MSSTVALPERLGRRMSVGPFEDPRDFLRFLLLTSAGALAAVAWGILAWAPFLVAAAILTLIRPNDESCWVLLDRRLRFLVRPRSRAIPTPPPWPPRHRLLGDRWFDLTSQGWEFWESAPSAYHGRSAASLLDESAVLVRELALAEREVVLYRIPVPWDPEPYLPARSARRFEIPGLSDGYSALLRTVARGKVRSRLVIATPAETPRRRTGTPEEAPRAGPGLSSLGWTRICGASLREVLPEIVPGSVGG